MRILIDLQGVQSASRFRGIGRYSLSLSLAMARNAGEHEIWLALNSAFPESILSIRYAFEELIPPERIRVFEVPVPVTEFEPTNAWRVRAAEKIREHFLQQLKPDVVHVASLFEGYNDDVVATVGTFAPGLRTAVTLYDLIPLLNQRDYLSDKRHRDYYLRKVQSLKKAALLLAISESSRHEAIEALQISPDQVVNISAAADGRFRPLTLTAERIQQLRSQYGIQRNMVMYAPGGFDQRKNFEGLIRAYSILSSALRATHQLVIVGDIYVDAHGHLTRLAKQAGLAKNELVVTGYVSDNELVELYNLATLFVFPSKHEGFGLPVLEAMACGAPVIGSRCTSIPEVIGLDDALFDPLSPQDISNKMAKALSDTTFRDRLIVHGLIQAKKFTWDECARRAVVALEEFVQIKGATLSSKVELKTIPELTRTIAEIKDVGKPTDADLVRVAECIAFNSGHASNKQLLLDISVIVHGDAKSGIQRVVRSLLREFIENPPHDTDVRPIYFDGIRYKYASAFTTAFTGTPSQDVTDEIVDFCQDDIYLALDLNAHLTAAVHDFHMHLQCSGIKLYFIVYDILLVQHPEWWPKGTSVIFKAWLESIAEVATGLICISEAVAEEVRVWLKQNPSQRQSGPMVKSFHLGADVENSVPSKGLPDNAQSILAALKATPSFLMVGTVEPRKGHAQTLAAFELLWAQDIDINLVIVGKRGWLVDKLVNSVRQHPELNKRLFWLEGISDEYLEKVYAVSACLIAASEGEGFGLPLIEAAQHKKPIIARDMPVFREVAGTHAFYFSGIAHENLAAAITSWLVLKKRDEHPRSEGMHCLTWRESAFQLKEQLNLQKKLYVDISDLVQKDLRTGIQRVTRSVLSALLSHPPAGYQVEPVYASMASAGYCHAKRYIQQLAGVDSENHTDDSIEPHYGDIFLGLDFVAGIVIAQQQYLKWMRNRGVRVYFVVYDLLPIKLPHAFPLGCEAGHRQWLQVIAGFDGAVCISRAVQSDLDTWLKEDGPKRLPPYKTAWFHLGADVENSIPSKGLPDNANDVIDQLKLRPSFLMVGTLEPRKGQAQTLAAFEQLWADNIEVNLVIVGNEGWMVDELVQKLRQHPERNRRLFWLEGISDEFLERIYAASACLIAASEDEGFGLPIVEGLQRGLPVICSDIPVFREIGGDNVRYFDNQDAASLAQAIQETVNAKAESGHRPKTDWLTWQESTQQLLTNLLQQQQVQRRSLR